MWFPPSSAPCVVSLGSFTAFLVSQKIPCLSAVSKTDESAGSNCVNCVSSLVLGYRCFKAVMFLTGLMFGSVVIFMLCYKERVLDTQLSMEASVGIGLGIGTLCGLVTMLVRSVGLFMVGLLLGLLVAVATLVGMEELSNNPPRSVWVPLGVLLGLGMIFAVLTLQWQRFFTTLSTSVFGAAVITVAVDYFVELFALVLYMYERIKAAPGKPVCWITWVVLGVWPALTVLGVIIQWTVTAEGYSHTKGDGYQHNSVQRFSTSGLLASPHDLLSL